MLIAVDRPAPRALSARMLGDRLHEATADLACDPPGRRGHGERVALLGLKRCSAGLHIALAARHARGVTRRTAATTRQIDRSHPPDVEIAPRSHA